MIISMTIGMNPRALRDFSLTPGPKSAPKVIKEDGGLFQGRHLLHSVSSQRRGAGIGYLLMWAERHATSLQ